MTRYIQQLKGLLYASILQVTKLMIAWDKK